MKLTAKTVAALSLPSGKTDVIVFDESLPRFGYRLRLSHDGTKVLRTWIVQYRRGSRKPRITLGSAGVVTVEAARAAARKILAKVDLGEDPAADRHERRHKDRLSLRSEINEYLAAKQPDFRAKTLREVVRYLTAKPYFGALHAMPIDKVTRRDIASRLVAITREHGPSVTSRARSALSAFFVWAMREGLVEANPVIGTNQPKSGEPGSRVLADPELAAVWRACGDDASGKIFRLLILLGNRRAEIGGIAWSELDLDAPQPSWTLPAERSKNHKAHTLPLMPMALAIIRSVPRPVARDQLFGIHSNAGFTNWDEAKHTLSERSGVRGFTPHDIRRTVDTRLHDLGIAPHVIEQILNHQSHRGQVGARYNKSVYEREVRRALATWERYIGLITSDLYAAHQAFLARGDGEAREKAEEAFHAAIAAGGGHWEDYLGALHGGERKVVPLSPAIAS